MQSDRLVWHETSGTPSDLDGERLFPVELNIEDGGYHLKQQAALPL